MFFLPIDPRDKDQKDPENINLSVPHRAQYLHNAWKKHQDAVSWVDLNLAIRKGLTLGEVLYEKSYMSPRPPPKISLRHDHDWTRGKVPLGSTVDQQPESKVVRQSRGEVQHATFSQLTQPIPKPIRDRSGLPEDMQDVFVVKGETSCSHEINGKDFHEKLCASDRSGQPDITPSVIKAHNLSENIRVEQIHDRSGQPDERNSSSAHTVKEQHAPEEHREIASFNTNNEFNRAINEEDIDFNIPGLPTFYSETIAWRRRSRLDSENREPPVPTRSSTRPTTKSII